MIARIGRLAGAILVECDGSYFLVGNTKEPCDWEQHGFRIPKDIDVHPTPVLALERINKGSTFSLDSPHLLLHLGVEQNGEKVSHLFAERLLIMRNASVSDRLWNLVVGESKDAELEATWLLNMPAVVWQVVRDTVLKCT
jgi:hypothetical protein